MRWLALVFIGSYRIALSPFLGQHCRYYPSCSAYAEQAVTRHGALRGVLLAVWRVLRCHPWCRGGVDLVPEAFPSFTARRCAAAKPGAVTGHTLEGVTQ